MSKLLWIFFSGRWAYYVRQGSRVALLWGLCVGCTGRNETQSTMLSHVDTIQVDLPDKQAKQIAKPSTSIFGGYQIIQLETNSQSLIGNIKRLVTWDSLMIIQDGIGQAVLLFDSKGSFLRKIPPTGTGPGEFIQISDFAMDRSNGNIFIMSNVPNKVLCYDMQGKFLFEYVLNKYYSEMAIVGEQIILASNNPVDGSHFTYMNKSDGSLRPAPFPPISPVTGRFWNYGDGRRDMISSSRTLFCASLDANIYELTENEPVLRYVVDFGSKSIDSDALLKVSEQELFSWLQERDLGYFIADIRENNRYLFFTVRNSVYVLFDKISKQTEVFNLLGSELGNFEITHLYAHDGPDETWYDVIDNRHLSILNYHLRNGAAFPAYNEEFTNLIRNFSENDNQVLIKYHVK